MSEKSFRELVVWQKGIALSKQIYNHTKLFPKEEIYGLTSQIRRAVVSIPANIAEGSQRGTTKDYLHFLHIADGSSSELETLLIIAISLFEDSSEDLQKDLQDLYEMQRMLGGLIKSLQKNNT